MHIEQKLTSLGLTLPHGTAPIASFVPAVQTGNLLFVSGHISTTLRGKFGRDVTREQGYEAARLIALDLLGTIRDALGDLDRVERLVKLLGLVNSTEDFTEQPFVINGASDLFLKVFEDKGQHARSAIGVAQLPSNAAVEIELILAVAEESKGR